MPFKDPERQREYQREYQRMRRAGLRSKGAGLRVKLIPSSLEQTKTASGLLCVLANLIKEVRETTQGDIFIRARTAGYLISIGLKAVEVADLEGRIRNLENKIIGGET